MRGKRCAGTTRIATPAPSAAEPLSPFVRMRLVVEVSVRGCLFNFDFDETIQGIVHEIKYRGQKRLAHDMGKITSNLFRPLFLKVWTRSFQCRSIFTA